MSESWVSDKRLWAKSDIYYCLISMNCLTVRLHEGFLYSFLLTFYYPFCSVLLCFVLFCRVLFYSLKDCLFYSFLFNLFYSVPFCYILFTFHLLQRPHLDPSQHVSCTKESPHGVCFLSPTYAYFHTNLHTEVDVI